MPNPACPPMEKFSPRGISGPRTIEGNGSRSSGARGLYKRYGAIEAVRGIDLDIEAGEIFGLIGPDGAGKTSTFQILAGVMEPSGEPRKSWAARRARRGLRLAI